MSTCQARISFETMVLLWAGELSEAEAEAVEAHLFGCDACSETSDALGRLVDGLREVIPPVVSRTQRERLSHRGLHIVQTLVEPEVAVRARFAPGVDLLVHVLQADLARAERVDLDVMLPDGTPQMSLENVPFDAEDGQVLVACQRHYRQLFDEGENPFFVVHAVERGQRKQVGRFFVEHIWE